MPDDDPTATDWPTAVLQVELRLEQTTARVRDLERQLQHLDRCIANLLTVLEALANRLERAESTLKRA